MKLYMQINVLSIYYTAYKYVLFIAKEECFFHIHEILNYLKIKLQRQFNWQEPPTLFNILCDMGTYIFKNILVKNVHKSTSDYTNSYYLMIFSR